MTMVRRPAAASRSAAKAPAGPPPGLRRVSFLRSGGFPAAQRRMTRRQIRSWSCGGALCGRLAWLNAVWGRARGRLTLSFHQPAAAPAFQRVAHLHSGPGPLLPWGGRPPWRRLHSAETTPKSPPPVWKPDPDRSGSRDSPECPAGPPPESDCRGCNRTAAQPQRALQRARTSHSDYMPSARRPETKTG